MFDTNHHHAFEKWWDYAATHYVSWDNGKPVAVDLYYDPIENEHVLHGSMGIIAPAWYFAPQQHEVAEVGWMNIASACGVYSDGAIVGLEDPGTATFLLQLAGEFADPSTKKRLWEAAEKHIEPRWDDESGEFTFGLNLNEPYPRGQLNARMMAGWVCTQGAWSKIFNQPNLEKFNEPTIEGVDFPSVALSEAKWVNEVLTIAAHPQNQIAEGSLTRFKLVNVDTSKNWFLHKPGHDPVELERKADHYEIELLVNNQIVSVSQDPVHPLKAQDL